MNLFFRKLEEDCMFNDFFDEDPSFVLKTTKKYTEHLKSCNLIDIHGLVKIAKENQILKDTSVLMVCDQTIKGPMKGLMEILFEGFEKFKIQAELSLDASINQNQDFEVNIEPWEIDQIIVDTKNDESEVVESNTEVYCQSLLLSFMKLLINSREEISLAKVIGPDAVLDHKIFTLVRKESDKTKMPMFQTIMSYVQKLNLGGKSYAPGTDHPFMPFNKELKEFVDLIGKLYMKLEDEADFEKALKKVMFCLKCHLSKSSSLRISSIEKTIESQMEQFKACLNRYENFGKPSGNKPMSTDKANLNRMQLLVDFQVTNYVMTKSVHELLGKVEPKSNGKTPVAVPNTVSMYTTPLTPDDPKKSVKKSKNKKEIEKGNQTPQTSKLGKPKFEATMAWAAETSPLVLKSSEKNVKTSGTTLAVSAPSFFDENSEDSMDFKIAPDLYSRMKISEQIKKGLEEAEKALKDAKTAVRPTKTKSSKRTILSDLKNVEKWEKVSDLKNKKSEDLKPSDKPAKRPKLDDISGQENATKKTEKVEVSKKAAGGGKKKQPALLKGQMKMTSFFR